MKQTRLLQVLVMVVLFGFGAVRAQAELTVESMKRVEQQWMTAYADGDVEGMMSLYTDDAMWDEMDTDPVIGKDAIREIWAGNDGTGIITLETTEAVSFRDWGYTSGRWTYNEPEDGGSQGFYTHVFRMIDGKVLYHRDVFSRCNDECPSLGFE